MKTKAQLGFHMHLLRLVYPVEQPIEAICLYENMYIPYRTIVFIRIDVREIRDCLNRERFEPTKNIIQQVLVAGKRQYSI